MQGTEGQFIEHRGVEELDIGILEHQADLAAESKRKGGFLELHSGDGLAAEGEIAGLRKDQAVEDAEQGGFAGTIRSQKGDALAPVHAEGKVVQGSRPVIPINQVAGGEDGDGHGQRPAWMAAAAIARKIAKRSQSAGRIAISSRM